MRGHRRFAFAAALITALVTAAAPAASGAVQPSGVGQPWGVGTAASTTAARDAATTTATATPGILTSRDERVLDTRGTPAGPLAPRESRTVRVAPAGEAGAVMATITAVAAARSGFLTAYRTGTARPTASVLNFTAGTVVSNTAVVATDAEGTITVYNGSSGTVNVIVDTMGWYSAGEATTPGSVRTIEPRRVLDTRSGLGVAAGAVAPRTTRALQVEGAPVSLGPADSVWANITVVDPTRSGYLTAYPGRAAQPTSSNLNFAPGQVVAALAMVRVGDDGSITVFNGSSGSLHIVLDIVAYVHDGVDTVDGTTHSLTPSRLLDTRLADGPTGGDPVAGRSSVDITVRARGNAPSAGAGWAVLTLTATAPVGAGYLHVYPAGQLPGPTSQLSFAPGQTTAVTVVAAVGEFGEVRVRNGSVSSAHVVADLVGFLADATPPDPPVAKAAARSPSSVRLTVTGGDAELEVRRTVGSTPPASQADGTLVAQLGTSPAGDGSYVVDDTGLTPSTTYSYGAFALDGAGRASTAAVATQTTPAPALQWSTLVDRHAQGHPLVISCPTTTFCMVVDLNGNALTYTGAGWSQPAAVPGMGQPTDLSCPTATFCMAVGSGGGMLRWVSDTWSAPVSSQSSPFRVVDCASPSFCVAGLVNGSMATWDGTTWGTPKTVFDFPALAIECPATGTCIAVTTTKRAAVLRNGSWSVPTASGVGNDLGTLSCPTASFCVAFGSNVPTTSVWRGVSWQAVNTPDEMEVGAVACGSVDSCEGVSGFSGWHFDGTSWMSRPGPDILQPTMDCTSTTCVAVASDGHASVLVGSTWSEPVVVDPPRYHYAALSCGSAARCAVTEEAGVHALDGSGLGIAGSATMDSVACGADGSCLAVDEETGASQSRTDAGWVGAPTAPVGTIPSAESCPSATFCMAPLRSEAGDGAVSVLRDGAWTILPVSGASRVVSVSCTSSTWCLAFDWTDTSFTYDGTTWSGPSVVPGDVNGQASCATPTSCAVVVLGGLARWEGTAWTLVAGAPTDGRSVSCADASTCAVATSSGRVSRLSDGAWVGGLLGNGAPLLQISCAGARTCVATAEDGRISRSA